MSAPTPLPAGKTRGQPGPVAKIAAIWQALDAAGPDASVAELEKHGLAQCHPALLRNLFHRAFRARRYEKAHLAQNALLKHPVGVKPKDGRDIPFMSWNRQPGIGQAAERYLFVSGVARSGTTALGRMLGMHRDVAMYIELYLPNYGYIPQMFAPENIQMLCESGLLTLNGNNRSIFKKSKNCRVVGDKRPGFITSAELTLLNFGRSEIKVVHILRNIYDVAASEQKRFETGRSKRNHVAAVRAANASNKKALELLGGRHNHNVVILDYDRAWRSAEDIRALYEHLGLDPFSADAKSVEDFVGKSKLIRAAHECRLSAAERAYVDDNYDKSAEETLRGHAFPQSGN